MKTVTVKDSKAFAVACFVDQADDEKMRNALEAEIAKFAVPPDYIHWETEESHPPTAPKPVRRMMVRLQWWEDIVETPD